MRKKRDARNMFEYLIGVDGGGTGTGTGTGSVGEYMLGRQTVHTCLGGVRLADGTLADASRRVSTFAADYLGMQERGRLATVAVAEIVVPDRDLNVKAVYVEGEQIDLTDCRFQDNQ